MLMNGFTKKKVKGYITKHCMKVSVLTIIVSTSLLLMGCVGYERTSTDWFDINIPKGASIVTNSDGVALKAEIQKTSNTQIFIEALPAEVSVEDAFTLIGKQYPVSSLHHSYPYPEEFDYSQVKGIKGVYTDEFLRGEDFCFIKDGYTVYACSYGRKGDYNSIREIVRSIDFKVQASDYKRKKEINSYLKQALPKQIKSILSGMMPVGYDCKDVFLIERNGNWDLECILDGNFDYPVFPYGVEQNNTKAILLARVIESPSVYSIQSPLLYTVYLLGGKISFKFLMPDNTPIILRKN